MIASNGTVADKRNQWKLSSSNVVAALILITCVKVLCIPTYRSTDFDVHRNWLAITRHLALNRWYFDDVNGTTVHTLDYPPTFAYFEYFLSSNPLTDQLIRSNLVDERCFALLPDDDNEPTKPCVIFHRSTVILSDIVLWIGAYIASRRNWTIFLLIVCNPGLIWLDHVHFQYNGMLLGLLLASLGLLLHGSNIENKKGPSYHANHLVAAVLFSLLLTMKHLYLPLAPLYFVFLLSNYCIQDNKFSLLNFIRLALVTGGSLVAPFLPFVLLSSSPTEQIIQIMRRLFPFGRGLVHDYWAANVWALWTLGDKILGFVSRKLVPGVDGWSLPEVSPLVCAVCLLLGLTPGLICAWKASGSTFVWCVVFCSFSSFMLAYHVHEKAIMTAILPLTLLCTEKDEPRARRLFLRTSALGLLGLFPLLFRSVELGLKVTSYPAFLAFASEALAVAATWLDWMGGSLLVCVLLFLEVLHPLFLFPRMEFLPLLITSVSCAVGLIACWIEAGVLMWSSSTSTNSQKSSKFKTS